MCLRYFFAKLIDDLRFVKVSKCRRPPPPASGGRQGGCSGMGTADALQGPALEERLPDRHRDAQGMTSYLLTLYVFHSQSILPGKISNASPKGN